MKYLSFMMAIMVLVLSTIPCIMEDKCIDLTYQSTDNQQNDNDCGMECCSPFFNCHTCTGFIVTIFHYPIEYTTRLSVKKIGAELVHAISDFHLSVWHPPQFA